MHFAALRLEARTPLPLNWGPSRATCTGWSCRADRVQRVIPGREQFPGGRVKVAGALLVPGGRVLGVEAHDIRRRPPDLVVGGGDHAAQVGARDGAAQGDVGMRGQAALRLDGGEVLDVVAEEAAQVLDEPVQQRGEVDRVPGGPGVVVAGGIDRGAVVIDRAVAVTGQGQEHRRPVGLAVPGGEGTANRTRGDLAAGQVRGVLAAPGGPLAPGLGLATGGAKVAADADAA